MLLSGDSTRTLREALQQFEVNTVRDITPAPSDQMIDRAYHGLGINQKRLIRRYAAHSTFNNDTEAALLKFRRLVRGE